MHGDDRGISRDSQIYIFRILVEDGYFPIMLFQIMKIKAECYSETCQTTESQKSGDRNLNIHRRKNLKSLKINKISRSLIHLSQMKQLVP